MRYQIVYIKRGVYLTTWMDNLNRVRRFKCGLEKAGYDVSIWEHSENGVREIV